MTKKLASPPRVVKVGVARRIPRSRIWLEGTRLISAGFVRGTRYNAEWTATGVTLKLCETGARKVAGAIERPIIDITGEKVRALGADRVIVAYNLQKIKIEKAE